MLEFQNDPVTIACIGECMIELSPLSAQFINVCAYRQEFAGDTLNTATYLARLLNKKKATVQYVTALGKDELSQSMIRQWLQEHIDCRYVLHIQDKIPGLYMINTDQEGERSFTYWRNDSAAKRLFSHDGLSQQQQDNLVSQSNYIYISGITLAILPEEGRTRLLTLLEKAKEKGTTIIFDSNYRPSLWESEKQARSYYDRVMLLTDIALLTFNDEKALFGDSNQSHTLKRYENVNEIVIKDGGRPCLIKKDGEVFTVCSPSVEHVIDATAAGDSFNGAYIAARFNQLTLEDSVLFAHKVAGTVIQHRGAIIDSSLTKIFAKEIYK